MHVYVGVWYAARAGMVCRRRVRPVNRVVYRAVSIMLWRRSMAEVARQERSVAAVRRTMVLHAKVPTIVKFAQAFLAAVEEVPVSF
jgi:hypothetical protein